MEHKNIIVIFFLNDESYAMRVWAHVPRVGDEVMLHGRRNTPEENIKSPYKVTRVVWGIESDINQKQEVNVDIVKI